MAASRRRRANRTADALRIQLVHRVEAYQRAHIDTPVSIARLCRVAGCSERGLRNAFHAVRGMSPRRCLVATRLAAVRQALNGAQSSHLTVTDAAVRYGFFDLGRFAASYKAQFGEAPSQTLRSHNQRSSVGEPLTCAG
jgi:AraC-like DNA-binding protein